MSESIKRKPSALGAPGLPDFRNLGVMLRVLLAVSLFAPLTVAIRLEEPGRLVEELALMAGRVELPLLLCVVLLYLGAPGLGGSGMQNRLFLEDLESGTCKFTCNGR